MDLAFPRAQVSREQGRRTWWHCYGPTLKIISLLTYYICWCKSWCRFTGRRQRLPSNGRDIKITVRREWKLEGAVTAIFGKHDFPQAGTVFPLSFIFLMPNSDQYEQISNKQLSNSDYLCVCMDFPLWIC